MGLNGLTRRHVLASGIATAAMMGTAWAQFPDKSVRWIVGYPPGGATDALARLLGSPFGDRLKQPIIVDNKPGAGSAIGATALAQSPADGYTIMGADNGTLIINPVVYDKLAYNPDNDFRPVGLYAGINLIFAVNASSPFRTIKEFMDKAAKEQVDYASPGIGSPLHLAVERLARDGKLKLNHVAYKGMAPALNDVIGGQVPSIVIDYATGAEMVKSGRLRALATFRATRLPALPDVPTFAETGLPGFSAGAWQGLIAPRNTPDAAIEKLSDALRFALSQPNVKARYVELGLDMPQGDPQSFAKLWQEEKAIWQPLIKSLGVKLD